METHNTFLDLHGYVSVIENNNYKYYLSRTFTCHKRVAQKQPHVNLPELSSPC